MAPPVLELAVQSCLRILIRDRTTVEPVRLMDDSQPSDVKRGVGEKYFPQGEGGKRDKLPAGGCISQGHKPTKSELRDQAIGPNRRAGTA